MTDPQHVHGLPPPQPEPEPALPPTTIAALVGLGLAAMGFLLVGLGFAFGVWSDDEDETDQDVIAAAEPAGETGAAEPVPVLAGAEEVPAAALDPAPPTSPDPAPEGNELVPTAPIGGEGGAGSGDESGASSGSGGGARGGSATKGGGPRVAVILHPIHYDSVEVRIGGSVFRIKANKTVKIRPGSYQVELRKSADAKWKPAGRLKVELGTRYRVKLFDPPLTKVEVLD